MGKGDRKTKKGKIRIGSYGKLRPKKKAVANIVVKKAEQKIEKPATKKTATKKKTTTKKVAKKKD